MMKSNDPGPPCMIQARQGSQVSPQLAPSQANDTSELENKQLIGQLAK